MNTSTKQDIINTLLNDTRLPIGKAHSFYLGSYAESIEGLNQFLPTFKSWSLSRQLQYILDKAIEKDTPSWTPKVQQVASKLITLQAEVEVSQAESIADDYLTLLSGTPASGTTPAAQPDVEEEVHTGEEIEAMATAELEDNIRSITGLTSALDERMVRRLKDNAKSLTVQDLAGELYDRFQLDTHTLVHVNPSNDPYNN